MWKLLPKVIFGIIGLLIILWWFRYDYITAGQGFIFRVDRISHKTSVSNAIDKEWQSIEESSKIPALSKPTGAYDDLLSDVKPTSPAESKKLNASEFLEVEPESHSDSN